MTPTRRTEILELLMRQRAEMARRFGACQLSLFGSAARDELRADSDVDVLVEFDGPASFEAYFGLKDYLEALLHRPVDLVTAKGLKPRARESVERDLIRVP
ncbi:MAG: nucleotidyltransferase family protein [Burkholderiaceae bacterium]|jgi:predicted nucleotidyltransferase|nr:nucleotidyltransferase family protein [Burkholderiaceae bacterium]